MKNLQEIKAGKISTTALKEASKSIRHLHHYYNKEKEQKRYFDFGNALELYVIDREAFKKEVVVFDDSEICEEIGGARPTATKKYKEWKSEFDSENEGKYIIPKTGDDSMEVILILADLLEQHDLAKKVIKGKYQEAIEWTDEKTGLKRYTRMDILDDNYTFITDIKTEARGEFERAANNLDYFIQAYDHYTAMLESEGIEIPDYYWVVFTKTPPYAVDVYYFDVIGKSLKVEEKYNSTLLSIKNTESLPVWLNGQVTEINPAGWYK